MSLRRWLLLSAVLGLGPGEAASAAAFGVDTTADAIDAIPGDGVCATAGGRCSVRAAILEANALPGPDVVSIPAGTYVLAIPGIDEDLGATGDLDILDDLTLEGAGALLTILDGGGLDFVVSPAGAQTRLAHLSIRGGLGAGVNLAEPMLSANTTEIADAIIEQNDGDGIFGLSSGLYIARTSIRANQGAGAYVWFFVNASPAIIEDSSVTDNHGVFDGGGLSLSYGFGDTIIRGSVIELNSPGGLEVNERTLVLEDSRVLENTGGAGVQLTNENAARIVRTTIEGNEGPQAGGVLLPASNGGAGSVLIFDSAIVGNTSASGGGGIKHARNVPSSLQLVNTTVSGNSGGVGGGIADEALAPADISLLNCTVTDNSAAEGGGIALLEPAAAVGIRALTLRNTIVAGNTASTAGPDCIRLGASAMQLVSLGHNLIGDATDCDFSPASGDLVGLAPAVIDPVLGLLEPNAVPTPMHPLDPGSAAIDAGDDSSCPGADQLGSPRPLDGNGDGVARCDIGAVEETTGDSDSDTFSDDRDNCPTIANASQGDVDADGVGDACDNCTNVGNARVPLAVVDGYEYVPENAWATLTGGQRDDDHDGFGNVCDGDFPGTTQGLNVNAADIAQFKTAIGHDRTTDACGTNGVRPCAIFDLNLGQTTDGVTNISGADIARFRALIGYPPGPSCPTCPLTCTSGPDGSCF